MSVPDWTPDHAAEALRRIGPAHLNAATVAVLRCPSEHRLARIVSTDAGPLYLATVTYTAMALPPSTRAALTDARATTKAEIMALHTPLLLEALAAAGLEDKWPASCRCGFWQVPYTFVMEMAERYRVRPRRVPQIVVLDVALRA